MSNAQPTIPEKKKHHKDTEKCLQPVAKMINEYLKRRAVRKVRWKETSYGYIVSLSVSTDPKVEEMHYHFYNEPGQTDKK